MLGFGLQYKLKSLPPLCEKLPPIFVWIYRQPLPTKPTVGKDFSTALKFLHPIKKDDLSRSTTTPIEKTTFLPRVKSE